MKHSHRFMLGATLLLATTFAVASEQAATRCADFAEYADQTPLPTRFKVDGFRFKDAAGGAVPLVQVGEDAEGTPFHGVRYDKRGLQIVPPKPTPTVRLRLLTRSGAPLKVLAYDAQGGVQASGLCTNENLSEELTFHANNAPISRIVLSGGADQGLVDQVCSLP
jgi:hypothetical protein